MRFCEMAPGRSVGVGGGGWIVHSWPIIHHVLNCQFSCLSIGKLRPRGGFSRQKWVWSENGFPSFLACCCWSNDVSQLLLLLTRVLWMLLSQSTQVLIWPWKGGWHLHLHLHGDCDAAESGTLHAAPCPLTCLPGGRADNLGEPLTAWTQTITSLKAPSWPEFRA